ncbi:hypothetical protein ACRS3X_25870 [Ectopseudomonas hydrolytica]|uniref:hypothetical protein n=1 Tax=Ectopseudomonas hydrolytica TaxID=2493633 RepID=UPI003EDFF300
MERLVISQKMKEWSLWALWWLLVGGAALWLFVGAVAYWVKLGFMPGEAAGWAQVFGIFLGLIGAAVFPAWHMDRAEQRRKREAQESLAAIANEAIVQLWSLSICLRSPVDEVARMSSFVMHREVRSNIPLYRQLDLISAADFSPRAFAVLRALREAADIAVKVEDAFPQWIAMGHSHPDMARMLRCKRDALMSAWETYSGTSVVGTETFDIRYFMRIEQAAIPSMLVSQNGFQIYTRFCMGDYGLGVGPIPRAVGIQLVSPQGELKSEVFHRKDCGWTDREGAERFAMRKSHEMLTSWDVYFRERL